MIDEQNEEKFYETHKYLGRELKKEGEGKKGPWKLFKLNFDVGGDFPKGYSIFDSAFKDKEGNVKVTLEEGKHYVIGYVNKPFESQHGPKIGRNAFFIKEASDEDVQRAEDEKNKPPVTAAAPVIVKDEITSEDLVLFLEKYKAMLKDKEFVPSKFVMTWFANKHGDEYNLVSEFAKEDEGEKDELQK